MATPPPQGQQQPGRGTKPGAMTMAMQAVAVKPTGPKVLRIGLIQDGKIVEERIVRRRETVSVGTSEKNHFIVQAGGLPARFELFQLVGNDYILNFTPDMRGRVGLPGGVKQLEQLRQSGARSAGGYHQVKLSDSSRGKIVLGNTTLLFQFVVPPPVTPRPQLPAAARGGFVKSIDWLFTAFVVFSYMTFFGFIIYLENRDWEIDQGIARLPDSVTRLIFQEPEPPPPDEPVEVEPTDEGDEAEPEEDAPATPTRQASADTSGDTGGESAENPNNSAEARARIAEEVAASAEAMILGALGDSGGALADVLAGGAATGSAEAVLAQVSGVGVASRSGSGALRARAGGGDGSGQGGGLGMLAASESAGMAVMTSGVSEMAVRGNIRLQGGGDIGGSGDFDPAIVARTIRTRIRAIQRCYEQQLRRNPTLAGKVTVQFTIVERGTVSAARATENTTNDAAVAACVVNTVRRFRFNPGPEGGSVSFSYPFVFAPQS